MLRYLFASIVLAITLTACGSNADESSVQPAETVVEATDASQVIASTSTSPLEAELGIASDPARRRYQLITLQRQADASLVQCMRDAGFFYAVGQVDESLRDGAFVGDGSREWVAEQGLGITSSFVEALSAGAAQAVPDADATNLGYVASLTPEQAADYDLALIGEIGVTSTTAEFAPAGCWGDAFGDILERLTFIDAFAPQLESLNSRLTADPRVLGFQQTWSACMNAAGHRYTNETAMVDDVYARLLEIELVDDGGITALASSEALDDLISFELQVGLASYDCRLSYSDELAALRDDYEREFLDDNRFRIADMQPAAE